MLRHLPVPALTLAATLAAGCTSAPNDSVLHSDSGIAAPDYQDMIASVTAVANAHPDLAQVIQYGTSVQGRPLMAVKIYDKSLQPAGKRPAVLISEAIHGNEYLNITDRLPRELIEGSAVGSGFRQLLAKGGVVYLVPSVNPDGMTAKTRENADGTDLNRDFTIQAAGNQAFTQPETKAISTFMAAEANAMNFTLETSMEYHCCAGGLIHPWNYDYDRTLTPDLAALKDQFVGIFTPIFPDFAIGNARDVVNYTTPAIGGSDDYYLETYGRRAFSFEGRQSDEFHNLAAHVSLWQGAFALAAQTYADATPVAGGAVAAVGQVNVAVETDNGAGLLLLDGVTPAACDGLDFCVGSQATCAKGGDHTGSSFVGASADGRRFYRATQPIQLQNGAVVTLTATKGGQAAGCPAQAVQFVAQ